MKPWQEDLERYLLSHEVDIALDYEDYGILKKVFKAIVGRKPQDKFQRLGRW